MDEDIQEKSIKAKRRNLFDEDEVDDFPIFSDQLNKSLPKNRTNLFDDVAEEEKIFSPTENVNAEISNQDLNISTEKWPGNVTDKKTNLFDDDEIIIKKPKKVSLFDDDDDFFNDDDFFSNITNTKLTSKLFEDIEEKSDNIFNIKEEQKTVENSKKVPFIEKVDPGYEKEKDAIIITKPNIIINEDNIETQSNLENTSNISNESVGSSFDVFPPDDMKQIIKTEQASKDSAKKALTLFDDSDLEDEGIFSSKIESKPKESANEKVQTTVNEVKKVEIESEIEEAKHVPGMIYFF